MSTSSMSTPISAVVEPRVVTKEDIRKAGNHAWKMNNIALKSIRDSHESPKGPTVWGVDLFDLDPYWILSLERGHDEAYTLKEPKSPWSWKQMLNYLDDATLDYIVGNGIIGITCQPIPDTTDEKRCRAWRKQGKEISPDAEVPIWDFVVTRKDTSRVCFHPNLKNKGIQAAAWDAPRFKHDGPLGKRGKSGGQGSFKDRTAYPYHGSFKKETEGGNQQQQAWQQQQVKAASTAAGAATWPAGYWPATWQQMQQQIAGHWQQQHGSSSWSQQENVPSNRDDGAAASKSRTGTASAVAPPKPAPKQKHTPLPSSESEWATFLAGSFPPKGPPPPSKGTATMVPAVAPAPTPIGVTNGGGEDAIRLPSSSDQDIGLPPGLERDIRERGLLQTQPAAAPPKFKQPPDCKSPFPEVVAENPQ